MAAHPAILPVPLNFRCRERALRKGLSYEAQLGITQHENGFDLVDQGGREAQWRNHSDNTLGSNNSIQDGMGCLWSGSKNVGIMDPTGETVAHQ